MNIGYLESIFSFLGGLGMFLYGMSIMGDGMQKSAGSKLNKFLRMVTDNRLLAVGLGALITAILHSSGATTVMVVGFVNAGILNLTQAVGVIMGANIGTTLGNGLIALPLGPLGLILAGVFALVYVFSKSAKTRNIALSAMGLSLIFYGLNLLTGGLKPLRAMPEVMAAISSLNADTFGGLLA